MDEISRFMTTHARLLDRRQFELITGAGTPAAALAALAAYRNDDGGYGSALEPDSRSSTSQPVAALQAFGVFEQVGSFPTPATELCDWLGSITLPDGGLPFALPMPDPTGSAPFFAQADPDESSLHMTSMLAGSAHRVGRHDPKVREHDWLATATDYSTRRIRTHAWPGHALELMYALRFLDAVHDTTPGAGDELRRLGEFLPTSGSMHVAGGAADEAMRPLDFAPEPDRPLRSLFDPAVIEADLDRLESGQQDDGGWVVDFDAYSPAAALEWRGVATVNAVQVLRANGRR